MTFLSVLQTAMWTALTADAALMQRVVGVYDDVPDDAKFPYVTLTEAVEDAMDFWGPGSSSVKHGGDITITWQIWSVSAGFLEAQQILAELDRLLVDTDLALSAGYVLVLALRGNALMLKEDDQAGGSIRRVQVKYHFQVMEA